MGNRIGRVSYANSERDIGGDSSFATEAIRVSAAAVPLAPRTAFRLRPRAITISAWSSLRLSIFTVTDSRCSTSLPCHVRRVIGGRSKEKMTRIDTSGRVTSMAYKLIAWIYTVMQIIRYAMSKVRLFVKRYFLMSALPGSGWIKPALLLIMPLDLAPKMPDLLLGKRRDDTILNSHLSVSSKIDIVIRAWTTLQALSGLAVLWHGKCLMGNRPMAIGGVKLAP